MRGPLFFQLNCVGFSTGLLSRRAETVAVLNLLATDRGQEWTKDKKSQHLWLAALANRPNITPQGDRAP